MQEQILVIYREQLAVYRRILESTELLKIKLDNELLDEVTDLVDRREDYIRELGELTGQANQNPTIDTPEIIGLKEEIQAALKQILDLDEKNKQSMESHKIRLQGEMRRLNQAKQARQGYDKSFSPDALYFDQKK